MSRKYKTISLFSGSGGMDLGFLQTKRFEIVLANDFDKYAAETYRNNIGPHIVCDSIVNLRNIPKVDVVIGGPPCQGFSTANPNRCMDDPRNSLFKEYVRVLSEAQPKIFLLENVSGMTNLEKGRVLKLILTELEAVGYNVKSRILDAKHYNTAQSGRRVIIVGTRKDLDADYLYPEPINNPPLFSDYVTVGDVIIKKPIPENAANHEVACLSALNRERIKHIPQGGSMKHCPESLQNNSDLKRAMRRLDENKVSYTIVHNNNDHYYHPTEDRRVTIREMARIQGYPDSFVFTGPKSEQSRQVGNSVPVPFATELAKSVIKYLEKSER